VLALIREKEKREDRSEIATTATKKALGVTK